jgi:hypothetical protein
VLTMVDQLALERAEETFDAGVVPAVPSAQQVTTMPWVATCCWYAVAEY